MSPVRVRSPAFIWARVVDDLTKKRIAWIGTGVMGLPMAGHLLNAGHQLVVHSRTKGKAQALIDRGALWVGSAAEAANAADLAVSMVGTPEEVEAVHLGVDGTLRALQLPRLIVDMSTSRPSLAREIHDAARGIRVGSLDAPVSGGDVGARQGTLSIMVGGDQEDFDSALPILALLGKQIVRQGGPGAGQHTKMVNQILIASNMVGICEGLLYAKRAGLDCQRVISSVGSGAAGSWAINNLGPRITRGDYAPGFFVEHFIKDLRIALEEADAMDLQLPGLALARRLYQELADMGHGRSGTQALVKLLEQMNALQERA